MDDLVDVSENKLRVNKIARDKEGSRDVEMLLIKFDQSYLCLLRVIYTNY